MDNSIALFINKGKMRRLSDDEKKKLLGEFRESGMTARDFSVAKGYSPSFIYTLTKNEKRKSGPTKVKKPSARFLPVGHVTEGVTIELPTGVKIKLGEGASRETIKNLLGVLNEQRDN